MSRTARTIGFIGLPAVIAAGVAVYVLAGFLRWGVAEIPAAENKIELSKPKEATIDDALPLIYKARDIMAGIKDYTAIYLRDEFIDGQLGKNQMFLKVRHEPFSVFMEWQSPRSKSGRKVAYVDGQNNGKMLVKEAFLTLRLDPDQSIKRKESRSTIRNAGLKHLVNRFCESWEKDKKLGVTKVLIQDGEVKVSLQGNEIVRPCRVVTTIHPAEHREHFNFFHCLLYIDKETGLPIRMQGYDWPTTGGDKLGQLLEDYVYVNMKTNVGLTDRDFKW